MSDNPKTSERDPAPPSNREKDQDDWTTGDEPMTGAQASYLKTLCEEAGEEFDPDLSKAKPPSESTRCAPGPAAAAEPAVAAADGGRSLHVAAGRRGPSQGRSSTRRPRSP
jgi:Protein of unknown function (DUF3072)